MKEELDVIGEDGRVVVYIQKEEAVSRLNAAIQQKNTAIEEKKSAEKAMRQSDGRLDTLRILIDRILDNVSPSGNGWMLSMSASDLIELRGMLDLKSDAA